MPFHKCKGKFSSNHEKEYRDKKPWNDSTVSSEVIQSENSFALLETSNPIETMDGEPNDLVANGMNSHEDTPVVETIVPYQLEGANGTQAQNASRPLEERPFIEAPVQT